MSALIDPQTVSGLLAVLVTAGGTVAFLRKRSLPSLLGGSLVGFLYGYAWWQLSQTGNATAPDARNGVVIAIAASTLLFAVMAIRFLKTRKAVPAILSTVAGASGFYFSTQL